jgi:D-alanyl-D-alanine carboxypeptidase (penicillin-binding protein 5/6)
MHISRVIISSPFRILAALLLLPPLTLRAANDPASPPEVKGASVVVIDAATGDVLYQRNPDEKRPVASTQKLLTSLIVAEQGNLEKEVVIEPIDEATEPTTLQLKPGTSYPRDTLLTALLVKSANDVARALGRDVGGSIEGFAEIMNRRAAALGATSSHFVNPNGLPAENQYSTAADMAKIARAAHSNATLRPIMATKYLPFRYADGHVYMIRNTNQTMRENWYCTGMKTGYTEKAKHCLVSSGEHDGREVISVILGSTKERIFTDSARILRWALGLPEEKKTESKSSSSKSSKKSPQSSSKSSSGSSRSHTSS